MSDFKNLDQTRKYDILIGLGFIEYFDEPKKIIKKLKPLTKTKRKEAMDFASDDEIDEKKELQKTTEEILDSGRFHIAHFYHCNVRNAAQHPLI